MLTFIEFCKLNEMSYRSSRVSLFILKCLCKIQFNPQIEFTIRNEFPIDVKNLKLYSIANQCEKITKIRMNDTFLNENSFASNEDYALSILNKYFTSNLNRNRMRLFLIIFSITHKITEKTIYIMYSKFHSIFNH